MTKKLYVGNLAWGTTADTLRQAFADSGRVVQDVSIVMDRETNRPRGFAFIEMGSEQDAEAAITALDGRSIDGRNIRVNLAQDRPRGAGPGSAARGPRPGSSTGGPGPRGPASGERGLDRSPSGGSPPPRGGPAGRGKNAGDEWGERGERPRGEKPRRGGGSRRGSNWDDEELEA